MKNKKNNIIYIDFIFKRRIIKSKPKLFFYKLYLKIFNFFPATNKFFKSKKQNIFNKRKTSNY